MLTGVLMNTCIPYYHSGQRFLCSAFVFLHFLFYFSVSSPFPFYFSLLPAFVFLPPVWSPAFPALHLHPIVFPPFPALIPCVSSPLHQFVLSPWISLPTLSSEFSLFSTSNWFSLGFFYVPHLFYWSMHWAPLFIKIIVHIIQVILDTVCTLNPVHIAHVIFIFAWAKFLCMHNIQSTEYFTLYCCIHCKFSCCVTEQAHLIWSYLKYQNLLSPT